MAAVGWDADILFRLTDKELAGLHFDVSIGGTHDGVVRIEFGPVGVGAVENEFINGRIAIHSHQRLPFPGALVSRGWGETALVPGAHRNMAAHDVNPY